jgi:hypothetical protein
MAETRLIPRDKLLPPAEPLRVGMGDKDMEELVACNEESIGIVRRSSIPAGRDGVPFGGARSMIVGGVVRYGLSVGLAWILALCHVACSGVRAAVRS